MRLGGFSFYLTHSSCNLLYKIPIDRKLYSTAFTEMLENNKKNILSLLCIVMLFYIIVNLNQNRLIECFFILR